MKILTKREREMERERVKEKWFTCFMAARDDTNRWLAAVLIASIA